MIILLHSEQNHHYIFKSTSVTENVSVPIIFHWRSRVLLLISQQCSSSSYSTSINEIHSDFKILFSVLMSNGCPNRISSCRNTRFSPSLMWYNRTFDPIASELALAHYIRRTARVMFSLLFVCLYGCVSVRLSFNNITDGWMNRFSLNFVERSNMTQITILTILGLLLLTPWVHVCFSIFSGESVFVSNITVNGFHEIFWIGHIDHKEWSGIFLWCCVEPRWVQILFYFYFRIHVYWLSNGLLNLGEI